MPSGFDALTHLDDPALCERLPRVLAEAREAGVTGMLVAGWDPDDWPGVVHVAAQASAVLALGAHPWVADKEWPIEALLDRYDPPVVGEIGLDHHRARSDEDRARQRSLFRAQLAWARACDRPVVVHAVRAVPEVLHVIGQDGLPSAGGMVHGWHAGPELAREALDLGLHLSIGPLLRGRHPHKIHASLQIIPDERLLLETDAPHQRLPDRPSPTPADLVQLALAVAECTGTEASAVLARTGANARRLFQVDVDGDAAG